MQKCRAPRKGLGIAIHPGHLQRERGEAGRGKGGEGSVLPKRLKSGPGYHRPKAIGLAHTRRYLCHVIPCFPAEETHMSGSEKNVFDVIHC